MISKPTVFVLGAGASYPYGFPLGAQLRQQLCNLRDATDDFPFLQWLDAAGFERNRVRSFLYAFLRSGQPSIDRFLSGRPDLQDIGKAAIATQLIVCEESAKVHNPNNAEDWYVALWGVMTDNVRSPDELASNRVQFLTFNYDRSLEFFLHQATKNSFPGLDDKAAMDSWTKIPIVHVYGELGEFHYAPGSGRRVYDTGPMPDAIKTAAEKLKVIPEAQACDAAFEQGRGWFEEAERICFLGFGFDALNMRRLDLNTMVNARNKKPGNPLRFYASVKGKYPVEIQAAKDGIASNAQDFRTSDKTNLDALREFGLLV